MNLKAPEPDPLRVMLLCGVATVVFEIAVLGLLEVLKCLT
jgi:hypothetical protein